MLNSNTFSTRFDSTALNIKATTTFEPKSPLDFGMGNAGRILGRSSDSINSDSANCSSNAIAFVDGALSDYQSLAAGFKPGTEVYVLNPNGNEMQQIDQVLAGRTNVHSLAIVSHGTDGSLQLGNLKLDTNDLGNYSSDLQAWAKSLAAGADILLYGCDVAASDTGKAFVQQIHQFTGADVAASTDLTGNAALGGNWTLEYHTGTIETSDLLQSAVESAYQQVLKTFTVTNTNGSGAGSLLQAVLDANALAGTDTINFNLSGPQTIKLAFGQFGQLEITDSVNIVGPGAANLTISGEHLSRVFKVNVGKTVQISGLTIANGGEINKVDQGGGILNAGGNLTVTNVTFKDNHVTLDGGAIANSGGTLTVKDSTFINNIASTAIGFQGGTTATNGRGGGIFSSGTVTVTNSTFTNNRAGVEGGGIMNSFGTMTVTGSTFTGNKAQDGGGILNKNNQSFLTVDNSTFTSNQVDRNGGGIANLARGTLTLTDSTMQQNKAKNGGGVFNESQSIAKVKQSKILQNTATSGTDVKGTFQSLGGNTIGKGAGSTGFVNGVNGDTVG